MYCSSANIATIKILKEC